MTEQIKEKGMKVSHEGGKLNFIGPMRREGHTNVDRCSLNYSILHQSKLGEN